MKIINKYVLKEHLGPFVFSLTALTSLMLLQYIAKHFSDLVGKGLTWQVIAEFFILSIPFTVAMTLPMAVLVAVLYAFSRLGSENEVTALKAGGVSTRALMRPVLLAAFGLAIVMLWFNDQVLPDANHRLETLQNDIMRAKPTFALREQIINPIQEERFYLRADHIDKGTGLLRGVTIYDLSDPTRPRTIIGDSGVLAFAPNQRDLDLTLFDGVIISVPAAHPDQLDRLYYHKNQMRVKDVANQFKESGPDSTNRGDREMSICDMQDRYVRAAAQVDRAVSDYKFDIWDASGKRGPAPAPLRVVPARGIGYYYCTLTTDMQRQLAKVRHQIHGLGVKTAGAEELPMRTPPTPIRMQQPAARTPGQTPTPTPAPAGAAPASGTARAATPLDAGRLAMVQASELQNLKALMGGKARYAIEIEKKFSLAAACVVLALVGAPIALRFPRGGVGLVIGVSFTIFALYYVCLIGGESLANNLIITPFWAMWAANAIFGAVGLILFARMGYETATARGGSPGELFLQLRNWIGRKNRAGQSS